jgi:hypothetical protein
VWLLGDFLFSPHRGGEKTAPPHGDEINGLRPDGILS